MKEIEYIPQQDTGYDHPEEIFFPEISLPPKAKEEDYEFPSIVEDEIVEKEDETITKIRHKDFE